VSLKVLPQPAAERTLAFEVNESSALARLADLARGALPMTASGWCDGQLFLRFEGSEATLDVVAQRLGGEVLADAPAFWTSVREQTHPFFDGSGSLWRCNLPPLAPALALDDPPLIEWNGQQRWYRRLPGTTAFAAAAALGGHATRFRGDATDSEIFAPLPGPLLQVHRALKREFDPAGILNPGRMYADL
jgi:glycolate oxidase FAD binding subunit